MKDEKDLLLDQLVLTVRTMELDTGNIEEHFETRLMARLEEHRQGWALWSAWTWRLVPWFTIIAIIVAVGSVLVEPARPTDMFTVFTNGYDEYQVASLIAGG